MSLPRYFNKLNNTQKHVIEVVAEFARHKGERVRINKALDHVDWDEFDMTAIKTARSSLITEGIITEDGDFIYRQW